MAPVAPAWFSTTKVWPRLVVILLAIVRAMVSVDPPGGNGTTTVTGFSGKAATAGAAAATVATAPRTSARRTLFIGCLRIGLAAALLRPGFPACGRTASTACPGSVGSPVVSVQYIFALQFIFFGYQSHGAAHPPVLRHARRGAALRPRRAAAR